MNGAEHNNMLGINEHLIGKPGSRYELATPALVLDLDALENNIQFMASYCAEKQLSLRPHCKTHKSVKIAQMQLDAGAIGLCVATVKEIRVLVENGIVEGIHLTTPLVGNTKTDIFLQLLKRSRGMSTVVDTMKGAVDLETRVKAAGLTLPVLIDLDLGVMYRSGVATVEKAVTLAKFVNRSEALEYAGVQFYSGVVQHIVSAEERKTFYGVQVDRLKEVLTALKQYQLEPRIVSGGGTGTFAIEAETGVFTENQAGSYAVMDVDYGDVRILPDCSNPFKVALFVQSSVISNNAKGIATIDAGSKCLAMDGPVPRFADEFLKSAMYQNFGDEFGVIIFPDASLEIPENGRPEGGMQPHESFYNVFGALSGATQQIEVGAKVELIVPHCDPTVNLHDYYHCVRGDTLVDIWAVDARGHL